MATSPSPRWVDAGTPSMDRQRPYLRIFKCTVFVRDQDRSLQFYLDQIGFRLIADARFESGDRWVAVAPPDGSTILVLVAPKPDSEEFKLIGRPSEVAFLTEDVNTTFEQWRKCGVRFHHPPQTPAWGGMFTTFEDVDGNTDGITESFNAAGEEFGEQRLIEALRQHRDLSSQALIASIVDEVRRFSPHEQHDDITLMVAKCKGN